MDVIRINDMVDRNIVKFFQDGFSIGAIQSELTLRMNNFKRTLEKDHINIEILSKTKFEDIASTRHRYGITYIKQSQKRIDDLTWILSNNYKFKNLDNSKIFDLLKFRDKLELNSYLVAF